MTPEDLAQLHARAMTTPGPWSAKAFVDLLDTPGTFLTLAPSSGHKYPGGSARGANPLSPPATTKSAQIIKGFALGRVILDEAELLTLAIDPDHQNNGLGRKTLAAFEAEAQMRGARLAHLEVAATNLPAKALYISAGWTQTGLRKRYYNAKPEKSDAILMSKPLNPA